MICRLSKFTSVLYRWRTKNIVVFFISLFLWSLKFVTIFLLELERNFEVKKFKLKKLEFLILTEMACHTSLII